MNNWRNRWSINLVQTNPWLRWSYIKSQGVRHTRCSHLFIDREHWRCLITYFMEAANNPADCVSFYKAKSSNPTWLKAWHFLFDSLITNGDEFSYFKRMLLRFIGYIWLNLWQNFLLVFEYYGNFITTVLMFYTT